MKIFKLIKKQLLLSLLFTLSFACVKDQNFSTPEINCEEPEISVTNTIQQVKEMYRFGGATVIENDVVIEGYVVSNDEAGNIYKTISIQDKPENPTAAIKIAINQSNLYTKYNVGRKIFIKLKGLAVGYSFGSFQIGVAEGKELGRIPLTEINKYIIRSCEVAEVLPKIISISELNEAHLEMLIQIENVQFKTDDLGKSYGNVDNLETVSRTLESFNTECELLGEIDIRNSGYSKFKNELLPEGKGSVTAIFSNYYEDFQLYIRNTEDVQLNENRCDYSNAIAPTITIKEVKELYVGKMFEFGVSTDYIIEGFVVSSDEDKNFEKKLIIQDAIENSTAGVQLLLDSEMIFEQFNAGDKIFVKLNSLYMNEVDGALTIGFPDGDKIDEIEEASIGDFIYNSGETFEIVPTEIEISEITDSEKFNTLVKVINVQLLEKERGTAFAYFSGTDDGIRILETCNEENKLKVFTNGNATFANEKFPEGKGAIIGVLNTSFEIRKKEDVVFDQAYENCPVIIPKILITEIADPKNSASARFVELYNAGESAINLTGWKLNKYVNGNSTISSGSILLDGIILPSGGFVILGNTGFELSFGTVPTFVSSYISGNGDDVYELVDNLDERIDIFGIIGEDGNGSNWEYLDGKAERKLEIKNPSKSFDKNEWIVSSNANNLLIDYPNTPKNAPNDYSPNYR